MDGDQRDTRENQTKIIAGIQGNQDEGKLLLYTQRHNDHVHIGLPRR